MEYGTERESIWIKGLYIVQTGKPYCGGAQNGCNNGNTGSDMCDFVSEMEGEVICQEKLNFVLGISKIKT
jgi:hypothetical protein